MMLELTDEQIDEAAFRMALRTVRLEVHQAVVEARGATGEAENVESVCPECHGYCVDWDDKFCAGCNGTGVSPASALTRAWEAAKDSVEGQVTS